MSIYGNNHSLCSGLLQQREFRDALLGDAATDPDGLAPEVPALEPFLASLRYGGSLRGLLPGLHVMSVPVAMTWVETLTGVGASGCHAVVVCHPRGKPPAQGHPFIPTFQVSPSPDVFL